MSTKNNADEIAEISDNLTNPIVLKHKENHGYTIIGKPKENLESLKESIVLRPLSFYNVSLIRGETKAGHEIEIANFDNRYFPRSSFSRRNNKVFFSERARIGETDRVAIFINNSYIPCLK